MNVRAMTAETQGQPTVGQDRAEWVTVFGDWLMSRGGKAADDIGEVFRAGYQAALNARSRELAEAKEHWQAAEADALEMAQIADRHKQELALAERRLSALTAAAKAEIEHDCADCRTLWCKDREHLAMQLAAALDATAAPPPPIDTWSTLC